MGRKSPCRPSLTRLESGWLVEGGVNGYYLSKPVEMQKLAGTIDTLLAKAADRKKEIRS